MLKRKLRIQLIEGNPYWIEHVKKELKGKHRLVVNKPDLILISYESLCARDNVPTPFIVFTHELEVSVTLSAFRKDALDCRLKNFEPGFVLSAIESVRNKL